ncbi:MAG: hypothetical protein MI743_20490 [Sneathiellales bacterium]|nr:hypothetical protein [Sneathiellales bacterium]
MVLRILIFLVSITILGGCSAGAYVPVVVSAHSDSARHSLNGKKPYNELVGKKLVFPQSEQNTPSLRMFRNGRYFVDFTSNSTTGIEHICNLKEGIIQFREIYKDMINGGIKFDAMITCPSGLSVHAPLNHWSEHYLKLVGQKL